MSNPRQRIRDQARAVLVWMFVFFLGIHLALGLYLHHRHPEFNDPEFTIRLRDLRARLAEAPGRPLALAVGSSRLACGLRPDTVRTGAADPLLFNFSLVGAGPVRQRMLLRRALEAGVHPRWLFIEVWAPLLSQRGFYDEEPRVFKQEMYWPDVPVIARLYARGGTALGNVLAENLTPALHQRVRLLDRRARFLFAQSVRNAMKFDDLAWSKLDGWGWLPIPGDEAGAAARMERDRMLTQPLLDDFRISAISDQALRDLLDDCRAHDIQAMLVLTPEHSALRSWYTPAARRMLANYLRRLSTEYQVSIVDASAWCGDEDFGDCCHLQPHGAQAFSERFGREVYHRLVAGQTHEGPSP